MYGMVHRAARQMVLDQQGPEIWRDMTLAVGLTDEHFIGTHVYSDELTLRIVGQIAQTSGCSMTEALESFGEYWIGFAYAGSYSAIMRMAGDNLHQFLGNLDRMHASLQVSVAGARLPTFEVTSSTPSDIQLIYRSEREGLQPFVKGLMQGLLKHFSLSGSVEVGERHNEGVDVLIRLA